MDWIEWVFGVVPDASDGSLETVLFIVAGAIVGYLARPHVHQQIVLLATVPPLAARRLVGNLYAAFFRHHRAYWRTALEGWILEIVWSASLAQRVLTVEEIARAGGLSKRTAQRKLKQMTGPAGKLERVRRNGINHYRVKQEWLDKPVTGDPSPFDGLVGEIHKASDGLRALDGTGGKVRGKWGK